MLYDWYTEKGPSHHVEPIIVDADDYMSDKKTVEELCKRVGLDSDAIIYTWPKASEEELNSMLPMEAKIKFTILGSDGVIPGRTAAGFDMAKAQQEWISQYGEDGAAEIKGLVERTMLDYENMRARKMAF
ncbi:uncharacterized protein HMPREF1541_04361 [Cyphellophora europaea CBS 101466]|uniref:Uncharacterized protein n=1 Tax=Cyphellophora europaea (strain CBS 101466) TaxID=1220924 RepID=W2RU97_CYPE1|nr:uncharacterized protein HMPREF1541_04361 [Cyphellophora europaea CBS 101466]ETN40086.1 hypothetical protein HMPREF1541_04361 [Cyphellophora europaea CBS 101466]